MIFLLLMAQVAIAGSCEKLIITGHPSYAPVAWEEGGAIIGASTKMIELIAQDLGLDQTNSWIINLDCKNHNPMVSEYFKRK
jgi:hypothetical protein